MIVKAGPRWLTWHPTGQRMAPTVNHDVRLGWLTWPTLAHPGPPYLTLAHPGLIWPIVTYPGSLWLTLATAWN